MLGVWYDKQLELTNMGIWTPNMEIWDDFSPKKGRQFGMATINHQWTGAYTCLHMLTP